MKKFEDFIFNEDLSNKLKFFIDEPEKLPKAVCFYGEPGTGKTSFANFFAENFAKEFIYIDGANHKNFFDLIKTFASTCAFFLEDKPIEKVILIDEIHNLRKPDFNKLKVPLENLKKVRFIFCANRDKNETIKKILTPAIYSRTHTINFDSTAKQLEELTIKAKNKYPHLSKNEIRSILPDFRKIESIENMRR